MKILFVENEFLRENSLSSILEQHRYAVDLVYGGDDGLEYARTGNYDLIILEFSLPGKSGPEVTRTLRREHVSTPILLLMPGEEVGDRLTGFTAGADDCLSRPFITAEFLARTKALCRRKGEYIDDDIVIGDVILNRSRREIMKDGVSAYLGGKEYEMMEMLALNQKHVISKSRFADKIWGYDSDAEYNNIEVYVSFLRRKLRSVGSSVKIKSVRGIGYCLQF